MNGDAKISRAKWVSWLTWLLWIGAVAGLAYLVVLTVWLGVAGLLFPYQLDYGEGVLLHFVKEWANGRPIYKGIDGYPYITSNYAPLTIVLALAVTPLVGISYAAGRLWTLLAIMALAIILTSWVRREGSQEQPRSRSRGWRLLVRRLPALAVAMTFVGSPYIYHWAPLFRVDLIGLALSLGGLYSVWRATSTANRSLEGASDSSRPASVQKPPLLWLAVLLFVAALFAKQSFVFAPLAALAYLFVFVDRQLAVKMAALIGLLGGGLFVLINALTRGGFWESLVVSNVNPFLWPEFWQQIWHFCRTYAVLGLLAAWYVVDKYVIDRRTPARSKANPLDLYLPLSLSSLMLAGKAGAWENYFFEALAALALCSGLGLTRLARAQQPAARLLAPLLLLVQVALMWHTPTLASGYLRLTRDSNDQVAPILASVPDPIISEDMGLLVSNGKVLDYYTFQYSQLARAGRWDQSWELEQLRLGRLSLVVLEEGTRLDVDRYQRFTREFLSELDRNYRRSRIVGKYELYEPEPLQHERRADFGDQLALVGWSIDPSSPLEPGSRLTLTAVWQAQQSVGLDYTAFAHLVDEAGVGWAGDDHQPYGGLYPTTAWGPMEMVRDTFLLDIPTDAPAGLCAVEVGWYDPVTLERLPVQDGNSLRVAVVPVGQPMPSVLAPVKHLFGGVVSLDGFAWRSEPASLRVMLRWSTDDYLDTDLTIFVHLVAQGEGYRIVSQSDAPPGNGYWPTSLWLPGVPVDDIHVIQLPGDLPSGRYALLVGLYDPATAERLTLPDGSDALRLAEISLP